MTDGRRQCGNCTMCCWLVPVVSLKKPGGTLCQHQDRKGCKIYRKEGFPGECALWSCRWLIDPTTVHLRRPDESRYVVDLVPDYIRSVEPDGRETVIPVVQIWCDPNFPDAHRDPELRLWLTRHCHGFAMLVRYNERDAITVVPPNLTQDGTWLEVRNNRMSIVEESHKAEDIASKLASAGIFPTIEEIEE